jgi:hypothetical protein
MVYKLKRCKYQAHVMVLGLDAYPIDKIDKVIIAPIVGDAPSTYKL